MGCDRQNVRKAAQIFSRTVAKFILQFFPNEKSASDFILLINNLFDLFNSTIENDKLNKFKSSFQGTEEQINFLSKAWGEIFNLRVFSNKNQIENKVNKSLLHFQIGIFAVNQCFAKITFIHFL